MSNNINTPEQEQDNIILKLRVYAKQTEGAPVYIIENNALIPPMLTSNVNNFFLLDNVFDELKAVKFEFNAMQTAGTPIILLCAPDNKKASKVYDILTGANITAFKQNPKEHFEVITSAGIGATRAELIKQYKANYSIGGNIGEFDNIIESNANTPAIKTGFAQLDKILDGGLYEGLYAIGAISSLGKTAFCLSIADNIAAQGHDVIIISMEMSKYEFIGRSISRLTFLYTQSKNSPYKYEHAKTERGITDGSRYKFYNAKEIELINRCKKIYSEKAGQNLFIYESIGGMTTEEIDRLIKRHIEATGNKPAVIIDYLQCLQHADPRINSNDKMKTDANLWALKRISRDNKLPIIAISSFNRESYTRKPTFSSFKESGAIEYTCSVIMSMYYKGIGGDIDEATAKAKNPREIVIEILKNRQGRTGDKINYYYYPMFNYFFEDTNGNTQPKADIWSDPEQETEPFEI